VRRDDGKSLDSMLMHRCRLDLFLLISSELPNRASWGLLGLLLLCTVNMTDYIARLPQEVYLIQKGEAVLLNGRCFWMLGTYRIETVLLR